MLPDKTHTYLKHALAGTPEVLRGLLRNLDARSPAWDLRPQPDRFSLREMLAHMADIDPIFTTRLRRARMEESAILDNWDEDQAAIDNNYAECDPHECLIRFAASRVAMLEVVESIRDSDWDRPTLFMGSIPFTLEAWVVQVVAHDMYHVRQTVEWLALTRSDDAVRHEKTVNQR